MLLYLIGVQSCGGQYAQCTGVDSNITGVDSNISDSIVVFRNKPKAKQPASGSPSSFGKCSLPSEFIPNCKRTG